MGGLNKVEVIDSKGCSSLFVGFSSSVPSYTRFQPFEPMSPAPTSLGSEPLTVRSPGPFSGLVICVTGLSKGFLLSCLCIVSAAASATVMASLNISYSVSGRKFEHALKHGSRNGLLLVKLGWFVDSVKRNVRLSESFYSMKGIGEHVTTADELNLLAESTTPESSCLDEANKTSMREKQHAQFSRRVPNRSMNSAFSGHTMYIDSDISVELRNKVLEEASKKGATVIDLWFVGCGATYVVCEGHSIHRYIGHSNNIVTVSTSALHYGNRPLWVLKTAKDRNLQRLVHMSAGLARQIGTVLENARNAIVGEESNVANSMQSTRSIRRNATHEERKQIVHLAETGVRNPRSRRPNNHISRTNLLEPVCWSISEPTSTASLFTDSLCGEDVSEHQSVFFDANGDGKDSEASFTNLTRSLTESEKNKLIFKNQFLTILFPVDRFSEMGPSSRTYFSDKGFTCLQILDYIYAFYQEDMSVHEIEAAIHTNSKYADRLRSAYSSSETVFKRINFLGSRKSFEMLKRVSGDNNRRRFLNCRSPSFLHEHCKRMKMPLHALLCMPNHRTELKGILMSLSMLASFTRTSVKKLMRAETLKGTVNVSHVHLSVGYLRSLSWLGLMRPCASQSSMDCHTWSGGSTIPLDSFEHKPTRLDTPPGVDYPSAPQCGSQGTMSPGRDTKYAHQNPKLVIPTTKAPVTAL
ncbi:hypothetical protein F3Y22_tig00110557pilonHSYRG00281 [Hibiscus syriacus]|uniref:BRCT domain-containing protein n=1 Tax=Hibiscus syriacus TaxID=106335 RepID=A0A6A3A9E9_HIBSY|nr:hypothetical protein F3Y22_tig00110557pilonHSYRG00281 [Hibiscus syriacus]